MQYINFNFSGACDKGTVIYRVIFIHIFPGYEVCLKYYRIIG